MRDSDKYVGCPSYLTKREVTRVGKPYTPDWRVVTIEPAEYNRRLVRLVNTRTGKAREIIYGDSVSDAVIKRRAPLVIADKQVVYVGDRRRTSGR